MTNDEAPMTNEDPALVWKLRSRTLQFSRRPLLMGIVNVTPDSFSDGGRFLNHEAAISHALKLLDDGADFSEPGILIPAAALVKPRESDPA